MEASSRSLI